MSSLLETDAWRFTAVVEDAVQRLELLRSLQRHVRSERIGKRSAAAATTMTSLLQIQSTMEDRYRKLSEQRQRSSDRIGDELSRRTAADLDNELGETTENLRHCRRSIARAIGTEDPENVRKLNEIGKECYGLIDQLRQLIFELSEPEHRFKSLSEKVWRCLSQERQLKETLERQSAAEGQRQALQVELQHIEERFADRNADIDAAIAQKTIDLKRATDDLAVQVKLEVDVSRAKTATAQRLRQNELDAIGKDIAQCDFETERETNVSAKTREFLERQIEANKTKLASWEAKFAEELAEKKEELASLNMAYAETMEQLDQLEARWMFEQNESERQAREAAATKAQAEKDAVVQRLHNAAATIQQAWRQSKQKKAERAALKKKKKKPGKKAKAEKGAKKK